MTQNQTFTDFLAQHLTDHQHRLPLQQMLADIAMACKEIAVAIDSGALAGNMGTLNAENIQGEIQKALDMIANDVFIERTQQSGYVAGMVSEEIADIIEVDATYQSDGKYLLLFDPLDGSSNVNVNISVGTIFSILNSQSSKPGINAFLQTGSQQICAGYALYGTSTMLVITVGKGVNGFTLDTESGEFFLTHPQMMIDADTEEFAVNMSNYRYWQAPVQQYIDECLQGVEGVRNKNFNMRWVASMVAEIHRILIRGGVFMYPIDSKIKKMGGKLRLLYEANPMAMIVEQAGGAASNGKQRILDIKPTKIHQRIPVMMGSRNEVERLETYHKKIKI
jgi:fructose-1,6-bisphosphatase I